MGLEISQLATVVNIILDTQRPLGHRRSKAPPHARGTANAEGIYGMLSSKLLSLSALFPQLPGFEFSPSCFQDIKGHVCNDNLLYCATFLFDLQMHLTSICKAAEQDALLGK